MAAKIINSLGLFLSILGVAVCFFYGFPQPSHEEGISLGLDPNTQLADGGTVAEHDLRVRCKRVRYLRLSRLGLGLIFAGFVLQLLATWM